MIQSMTGFGRASAENSEYELFVEVSSVNSRFFDLSIHLPRPLLFYQQEVRNLMKDHLERGKVNLFIQLTRRKDAGIGSLQITVLDRLVRQVRAAANQLGLEDDLRISHLPQFESLLEKEDSQRDNPVLWKLTERTIRAALKLLKKHRQEEGKSLQQDFRTRLSAIRRELSSVEGSFRKHKQMLFAQLSERVKQLVSDVELPAARLHTEVALLVDKMDISEEITRLRSHLDLFLSTIKQKEPVGKRLNFLLQEMNREANTIASKSNRTDISHRVVIIKEEVENLREQVQNVE